MTYTYSEIKKVVNKFYQVTPKGPYNPMREHPRSVLIRQIVSLIMSKRPGRPVYDDDFVKQYQLIFKYVKKVIVKRQTTSGRPVMPFNEHLYIPLTRDLVDDVVDRVVHYIFKEIRVPRDQLNKVPRVIRRVVYNYFIGVRRRTLAKSMPKILSNPNYPLYDIESYKNESPNNDLPVTYSTKGYRPSSVKSYRSNVYESLPAIDTGSSSWRRMSRSQRRVTRQRRQRVMRSRRMKIRKMRRVQRNRTVIPGGRFLRTRKIWVPRGGRRVSSRRVSGGSRRVSGG